MKRPTIGGEVRFTERGAGVFYTANGCWPNGNCPTCYGVLGKVVSIGAMNICTVMQQNGETTNFIWKFNDGVNKHFEWD